MNKIITDYGKSGKNYYYKDNQLYTEAGGFVPEGEALVLHFRETGRTPLVSGRYTQPLITFKEDGQIDESKFIRFGMFLDCLPEAERADQIRLAVKRIKKHIIFLPQTGLDGDSRDELELAYEKQIEALEQRLQGTKAKSWDGLRQDLIMGKYIEDVSPTDFDTVMNDWYKRGNPILWKGHKTEAAFFCKKFHFKMKDFKKCFLPEDGKPFHAKNATDTNPSPQFLAIINKYKPQ